MQLYEEGAVTDRMCQKWIVKFLGTTDIFGQVILCCGAVLHIGRCLAAPLASPHEKPIVAESRHTQNTQINTDISKNEKMCLFLYRETKRTFGPTQSLRTSIQASEKMLLSGEPVTPLSGEGSWAVWPLLPLHFSVGQMFRY